MPLLRQRRSDMAAKAVRGPLRADTFDRAMNRPAEELASHRNARRRAMIKDGLLTKACPSCDRHGPRESHYGQYEAWEDMHRAMHELGRVLMATLYAVLARATGI